MQAKPLRESVAPIMLLLSLVLGGSAQGIWVNAALQVLAVLVLAWAYLTPAPAPLNAAAKGLVLICMLGLAIIAIQLVPLPPAVWTALPGREDVAAGFQVLGQPLPWLTITLTPDDTVSTSLRLLPPIAILVVMLRQNAYRATWLAWALVAGTCAGVLLGALQVTSGGGAESPWYPYPISNFGTATGFFANSNHMAILLVATIPFLFALLANAGGVGGKKALQRRSALYALAGGLLLIVVIGLVLNGSLAGFGLGLPVLVASAILLMKVDRQRRWLIVPGLLLLVSVTAIFTLPVTASFQSLGATTSVESRRAVTQTSLRLASDFMPVGSGIGSYQQVYRLYEDPAAVDRTYVNHAHNDYLEIAVESGVLGIGAILFFLTWWGVTARRCWMVRTLDPFAKAAAIASAALLAHSLVDFPLRTTALAVLFAVALCLMLRPGIRAKAITESDLWPTRHLRVR